VVRVVAPAVMMAEDSAGVSEVAPAGVSEVAPAGVKAEETVEAPAEETVEAPAEETVEAPAEETVEAPAEETVEAPAEETVEEPVEATVVVDWESSVSSAGVDWEVVVGEALLPDSPAIQSYCTRWSSRSNRSTKLSGFLAAAARLPSAPLSLLPNYWRS